MCTSKMLKKIGRSTLYSIVDGYNYVCKSSRHVGISEERIQSIAKYDYEEYNNWIKSSKVIDFSSLTLDETIEFLIFFHNINFSYWGNPKWEIETKKYGKLDGSLAMLYVCLEILKDNDFNPENIARLSFKDFSNYFNVENQISLLRERYHNTVFLYSDICDMLRKRNLSTTYDLFRGLCLNDEVVFGFIINNFGEFFDDYSRYNNHKIPFYKRAQLLTSDIMNVLNDFNFSIPKTSNLIGCADYKIPQLLNKLGVLYYDDILTSKIASKEIIPRNHSFEVEIRANTLKVIEMISNITGATRMQVNDTLWLMSQKLKKDKDIPYHLTRTTAY